MTDFDYYRPSTVKEAYDQFMSLNSRKVFYHAGGTELVTSFRKGQIQAEAIIDVKAIQSMQSIETGERITIGACVSLNRVIDTDIGILKDVLSKIGDHTVRNAITVGGNICGRLPFREAILPLLALDAKLTVYTENQMKEIPVDQIFDKRLKLKQGDLLVAIQFEHKDMPYDFTRITESTEVDYPVLSMLIAKQNSGYFIGVSGLSSVPVYKTFDQLDEKVVEAYFEPLIRDDLRAGKAYKHHLFKEALSQSRKKLEVQDD
jgi:xanthine dehydrogenase molybdenum-binding subunit